nr:hypothetical protein GCM10017745_51210 [Saccharothrix mutabilis subsp. capreolus]
MPGRRSGSTGRPVSSLQLTAVARFTITDLRGMTGPPVPRRELPPRLPVVRFVHDPSAGLRATTLPVRDRRSLGEMFPTRSELE